MNCCGSHYTMDKIIIWRKKSWFFFVYVCVCVKYVLVFQKTMPWNAEETRGRIGEGTGVGLQGVGLKERKEPEEGG